MTSIMNLNEVDGHKFIDRFEAAAPIVAACLFQNFQNFLKPYQFHFNSPDIGVKYIKLHHYALVSSVIDALGLIAADEFSVDKDKTFKAALDILKTNLSQKSFNNFFSSFPFSSLHGQDILLFRAIENASLDGGLSLFDYQKVRVKLGEALLADLASASEYGNSKSESSNLASVYGSFFSDELRFKSVDMSFNSLTLDVKSQSEIAFVKSFEAFMVNLPANVYHCHEGKTLYSNRGFKLPCDCGQLHMLDECEAVCDFYSQFTVFRSPCGTSISKVVSDGMFRIKGIKVVSKITASSSLIDIVEQAVSSRKRID